MMKKTFMLTLGFMAGLQFFNPFAGAQTSTEKKLIVGTKNAAPFSMEDAKGDRSGLSIELWEEIAADLGLAFEYREMELAEILERLENGELEAAVAALTLTSDRETRMDFSHPFYTAGLGIAVQGQGRKNSLSAALKNLASADFLKTVGVLGLVLLLFGFLIWLAEHGANQEQFGSGGIRGIGAGFWWSAVTMTTVGYGDKAPVTFWGRFIGLIWMFAAIIMISSFTAAIASSLTVTRLESSVRGPEDLPAVKVGTLPASVSADYLTGLGVEYEAFESLPEAMRALARNEIDAVVYDAPLLRYTARNFGGRIQLLPDTFKKQHYGIGFPQGSALVEPVNRSLLKVLASEKWQRIQDRYLGK